MSPVATPAAVVAVVVLTIVVYYAWLGRACAREFRRINEACDLKWRMELDDFIDQGRRAMSEVYMVREERDRCDDVCGYAVCEEYRYTAIDLIDTNSKHNVTLGLVFQDKRHAEDFAAALNLGRKARQSKGE